MTTPLTDEQREALAAAIKDSFYEARDQGRTMHQAAEDPRIFAVVTDLLAAERERADRAEKRAHDEGCRADALALQVRHLNGDEDPDPSGVLAVDMARYAGRLRERADREKARADALEDVIAKVRALLRQWGVEQSTFPHHEQGAAAAVRVCASEVAALLPDDTKEADRG